MIERIAAVVVLALLSACGSDSSDGSASASGGASGNGSGGSSATDGGSDASDCDPRPGSLDDGGGTSTDATIVVEGGSINLEGGGEPMPRGFLKCYDPETGAGFDCSLHGMICCEKKDDCYDPATDPTFCDRPWCQQ